jgi:hypothetical protein
MAETIKIGGELESMATGKVVAAASAIKDKARGKTQDRINTDVEEALNFQTSRINALTDENFVTYTANSSTTTVESLLPVTGSAGIVYRIANWDGSQYDTSTFAEYAWDTSQYKLLNVKNYNLAGSQDFVDPDDEQKTRIPTVGAIIGTNGLLPYNGKTNLDANSGAIERKVNALIDSMVTLIQNVVFYAGVPYNIPLQLLTDLQLLRIGGGSSAAICGQAVCGQVICGQTNKK